MERFIVVIEKGESNYGAFSPDVLGCIAVGDTVEETLHLFQEALQGHLKCMAEDGDPLPLAKGIGYYLENEPEFYEADDFLTHVEVDLAKYRVSATA